MKVEPVKLSLWQQIKADIRQQFKQALTDLIIPREYQKALHAPINQD